jgi:hypothetical protein
MLLDGIKEDAQCAVKGFAVVLEVVAQPLGQGLPLDSAAVATPPKPSA